MISLGHLDVNVVLHCNMRCVSCSHAAPVSDAWTMTPEMLARDLAVLRPIVHFHVIQMVGGEPTLHKGLVEMIRVAKDSGVGDSVSVTSNGRNVHKMSDDFWGSIDWLNLSIYPTLPQENIAYAKQKCDQHNKPLYSREFNEFHQQLRQTPGDGSNYTNCHWRTNCFTCHDGYFFCCPQSAFFPKAFMGIEANTDGLPLVGVSEAGLRAYLDRPEPYAACRICAASEMKPRQWAESKTREEWMKESVIRP